MADSKGIYFGGQNTGLATILPRESRGDALDYALKYGEAQQRRKLQEDRFKLKQQQDTIKNLKQPESWRMYTPVVKGMFDELVNKVKGGNYDPLELQMDVNKAASLAQSSMQLKSEQESAAQAYKQDKKVVNGMEYYLSKYHSDPSLQSLEKIQEEGLDPYAFLNEAGGSQFVNTSEAFTDVINGSFKDFVRRKNEDGDARRKYIGRGVQQLSQDVFESEFRNFAKVNPVTGEIEVKEVDQLIKDGVLNVFLGDPYTKRVLEDRALELAGEEPVSDQHYGQALKEQLAPRSAGKYNKGTKISTAREAVDFAAAREADSKKAAGDWLVRVKQGDLTAWEELTRTKDGKGTITGVQKMGDAGTVRLIIKEEVDKYTTNSIGNPVKIPGETETKTRYEYIPYHQMSDEDLLGWYGQALKRPSGSKVNDKNRPSSKGYLDNITESNYDL